MHCIRSHKLSHQTHANFWFGRCFRLTHWHFLSTRTYNSPDIFFFFSVVYRLVGCDSSFCLCRVFFCFSFVFSLSAALFVYKVSRMCVRVCCRVFCEKCFWVLSVWMPCNFFRAVDDSSRCWSPLSERVPIELRPVGSANWCWIHLFFPPVCANC